MSPVLLYATHFAQEIYHKEYSKCTVEEQLKVRKAANNKVRAALFLMLSHNNFGSHNKDLLKEKHNQYLGGQDMYPPDVPQALRQVTSYRPSSTSTNLVKASNFAITGSNPASKSDSDTSSLTC